MEDNIEINYNMSTATFFVNIESSSNKMVYRGQFEVKTILGPLEYIQSDALYRDLLGKNNPHLATEYVGRLCYALSQLKYRIITCPEWFKNHETGMHGSNIDDTVLLHILEKTVECEEKYRKGIEKKYKNAQDEVKAKIDADLDGEDEEEDDEEREVGNEVPETKD